jgi:diaminohydroxyphosphoribosylaminopyrimidine deaminase / 5-amino-6-(5-phosphoribosylamino)uracil reductase
MPHVVREVLAMRQAVLLSARGLGTTSPNPPVGCVVLGPSGDVVGTGFHERKGGPHAEGIALATAGPRARGGTAVVTLEPCNHVGVTPACRQLLLDAGVARVVIAVMDPTSRGGGGAAALRRAGVDVEVGLLASESRLVLGPWLRALDLGRPVATWLAELRDRQLVPAPVELVDDLRRGYDAVLLPGRGLVEGIPGGHGRGAFRLPEGADRLEPRAALEALYEGGTRTLLLGVDPMDAQGYLDEGLIDELLLLDCQHAREGSPGHPAVVLNGFGLERVSWRRQGLLAEFAPKHD